MGGMILLYLLKKTQNSGMTDNMSKRKQLFLLSIALILIIGVCECMSNNKKNKAEEMRDFALSYLQSRYDDTFTAKGYSSSNWAYEYSRITFFSQKHPGFLIEVRAFENDDGTYYYTDNYFKCFMLDDAVAYFDSIVKDFEPITVKVRFPSTIWSDELNNADSFNQWKSTGNCRVDVFFITQQDLSEDEKSTVVHSIADSNISGMITFLVTNRNDNLIDQHLDDILNNQNSYVESESRFYIRSNFEIE